MNNIYNVYNIIYNLYNIIYYKYYKSHVSRQSIASTRNIVAVIDEISHTAIDYNKL